MKHSMLVLSALAAFTVLAGLPARADNMASIAITPATGAVTLVPRWGIGGSLVGFHLMAQNTGFSVGANNFYSIKGTTIPPGGDITAFTYYIAGSGAATNHADVGSKLTPDSYSALTSADPDLGYGAVNFYFIHHKGTTDYFTVIVPGSATASAVTDLKPMSGPGGPATVTGVSGYFGLTFAAANLGYGLNYLYYLRTDPVTGLTKFGILDPALLSTSADQFDLGMGGHNALTFTGTDVGYGVNKMYYLRLDPITGFTILGMLDPALAGARHASDIANLGSVYSTLDFVPGDVGFGTNKFYTTGAVNTTWQSVSFAAIADCAISAGSFTVTPSASSGLPIALTVVPGSAGAASISGPVAGVFTVTPVAPGLITLQATQAGQLASPAYEYNMLRQSFTATGVALLAITTQPTSQSAVTGTTANFSVTAPLAVSYQWRKAGANITGNGSATTATLTLTNVQAADVASYDVVVTNASGSILSNAVTLTVTTAAPVITNSPLTAAGTVGTPFSFTITATNSPTSYTASTLPLNGLSIVAATGVISGTPTAVGTMSVLLGATNAGGTGNATLTITIAAAGVAPIITNSPLTAAGTVGTPFSFTITATGSPTSYAASTLPLNGLSIVAATGVITGTPTAAGTMVVVLGATNATGTGNATLTITIAAAGVAPIITNSPLTAAGTVGTPFSFTITATGSPVSYAASTLPLNGLSIVAATGVISGTPTAAGTMAVLLGATNATGTGNATLTITIAAAGVAPVITNSPLTAAGTVGTPFSFAITASGSPTSYTATLPAGLSIVATTGVITGTPTAAGTTAVVLGATNAFGTGNATLTITIADATTISSATASISSDAQSYTIAVTSNTSWTASSDSAWATVSPASGTGDGTVTVTVTANTSTSSRTAIITIDGQTQTLTQAGVAASTTISSATASISASAQSYTIAVTSNTSWTASSDSAWATVSPASGTGNGTVTVTVTANTSASSRTATITIGGQTQTLTQAGFPQTVIMTNPPNPVTFTTLAGLPLETGSLDGTGSAARFDFPCGTAPDNQGNLYVADTDNGTIRMIAVSTGVVTTLAGTAGSFGSTDGTGSAARFDKPTGAGVAVDGGGNVYVADTLNNVLRKVTLTGVVTTLAGSGTAGSADGTGGAAQFSGPQGLAYSAGNLYVADTNNHTIRKVVVSTGVVTTFAGLAGNAGSSDGSGSLARFNYPTGVAVDSLGNLFVADTDNHTIREIQSSGLVSTLAGLAGVSGAADGTGNAVRFNSPSDVAVDASDNVYIADTDNDTIRMLVPSTGAVTTLAGLAGVIGSTDGSGSAVRFFEPAGLAVDTNGNLYVADTDNNTIRMAQLPLLPSIQTQPQSLTVLVGVSATFEVAATGRPAVTYQWQFNGTPISGATSSIYSISSAQSGNAGKYTVVVANVMGSVTSNPATLTVNAAPPPPPPPSGGGGGAVEPWFALVLALLFAASLVRTPKRV
jgi:hypothetical protein